MGRRTRRGRPPPRCRVEPHRRFPRPRCGDRLLAIPPPDRRHQRRHRACPAGGRRAPTRGASPAPRPHVRPRPGRRGGDDDRGDDRPQHLRQSVPPPWSGAGTGCGGAGRARRRDGRRTRAHAPPAPARHLRSRRGRRSGRSGRPCGGPGRRRRRGAHRIGGGDRCRPACNEALAWRLPARRPSPRRPCRSAAADVRRGRDPRHRHRGHAPDGAGRRGRRRGAGALRLAGEGGAGELADLVARAQRL